MLTILETTSLFLINIAVENLHRKTARNLTKIQQHKLIFSVMSISCLQFPFQHIIAAKYVKYQICQHSLNISTFLAVEALLIFRPVHFLKINSSKW